MASHSFADHSNLKPCHRSQSDSNLLNPHEESNGTTESMVRMGSVGDLSPRKLGSKKKGFLYKLVRPWKWRIKRKSSHHHGEYISVTICSCISEYACRVTYVYAVMTSYMASVLPGSGEVLAVNFSVSAKKRSLSRHRAAILRLQMDELACKGARVYLKVIAMSL